MLQTLIIFCQREVCHTIHSGFSWVLQTCLFFAVVLLLTVLTHDQSGENIYSYGWGVMTLMALIGGNRLLDKNKLQGQLETLVLLGVSLPAIMLTHILLFWSLFLVPLAFLTASFGVLMGNQAFQWVDLATGSLCLAGMATLFTSIVSDGAHKYFLGPLLMIPLGIPLFVLLGLQRSALDAQPFSLLLSAYALMLLPLCVLLGTAALRKEMASR